MGDDMRIVVVGLDPGVQTGVCFAELEVDGWGDGRTVRQCLTGVSWSDWNVETLTIGMNDDVGWWDGVVEVGNRLANMCVDRISSCGLAAEPKLGLFCMEDFILRPDAGLGGRDVVVPVAIGSVIWDQLFGPYPIPGSDRFSTRSVRTASVAK